MSDNTTAIERLLDESNKLWDAMYVSGEVPTYGERYYFFRAMADAMDEDAKLRELCASLFRLANNECLSNTRRCDDCPMNRNESPCNLSLDFIAMRELGIDVTPWEVEKVEVSS